MKKISTAASDKIGKVEGQRLTVGLDVGDRSSWYCVLDEAGAVLLEQKLPTTASRLNPSDPEVYNCSVTLRKLWRSACPTTNSSARNARNSSTRFCLLWTTKKARCSAHTAAVRKSSSAGRLSPRSPPKRAPEDGASNVHHFWARRRLRSPGNGGTVP